MDEPTSRENYVLFLILFLTITGGFATLWYVVSVSRAERREKGGEQIQLLDLIAALILIVGMFVIGYLLYRQYVDYQLFRD